MLDVAEGKDPAAERRAERATGTFAEMAGQYVELHAKGTTRVATGRELVQRHLLPRWGRMKASAISRADVRAMMLRIDAPIVANQTLAAASAIFSWAVKQEIVTINPCHGVDRNPTSDRERVLSDAEIALLWPRLDPALRLILLTGQRPGEVAALEAAHIVDGFWQMPGKPVGDWPGTKNGARPPGGAVGGGDGVDREPSRRPGYRPTVAQIVEATGRRTRSGSRHAARSAAHRLTWITRLKFGRDAMDRIANHRKGGVTDIYDRHGYEEEDRRIMSAIAGHLAVLVGETAESNVVALR